MNSSMTGRTESDHQLQDGPSGYAVMHDDRSLGPARGSTDSAAMTVAIQHFFSKTTEMRFILPTKRVAGGTHAVRQNTLASAPAVHGSLTSLLHAFTFGFALPMYL
jgi:hypothetical protein